MVLNFSPSRVIFSENNSFWNRILCSGCFSKSLHLRKSRRASIHHTKNSVAFTFSPTYDKISLHNENNTLHMKNILYTPLSGRAQAAALFVIFLGTTSFLLFDPPFIAQVVFVLLCFSWAAWCFVSVFQGPDEMEAASARYALAFASSIGVPISIAFIVLMGAVPSVQNAITGMATSEGLDLIPAAAGFGLGVVFTTAVLSISFCVGLIIWWVSKR